MSLFSLWSRKNEEPKEDTSTPAFLRQLDYIAKRAGAPLSVVTKWRRIVGPARVKTVPDAAAAILAALEVLTARVENLESK